MGSSVLGMENKTEEVSWGLLSCCRDRQQSRKQTGKEGDFQWYQGKHPWRVIFEGRRMHEPASHTKGWAVIWEQLWKHPQVGPEDVCLRNRKEARVPAQWAKGRVLEMRPWRPQGRDHEAYERFCSKGIGKALKDMKQGKDLLWFVTWKEHSACCVGQGLWKVKPRREGSSEEDVAVFHGKRYWGLG